MKNYKALFMSFFYAFRGIFSTIQSERNMRVHLTCVIYMFSILSLTDWFVLTKGDVCALLIASSMVLSCEVINTAIENTVDMSAKGKNDYAKRAKDAASGAVLINAIFAVAIGIVVLFQPEAFRQMHIYFTSHRGMFLLFALSIVPATLFIFFGIPIKRKGKNKK